MRVTECLQNRGSFIIYGEWVKVLVDEKRCNIGEDFTQP